jgi:hypothetical protein
MVIVGSILSGPGAMMLVSATHPQPPWRGPEAFAEHWHPIQSLPFFLGLVLVSGFVVLVSGIHARAHTATTTIALVFTSAFASLVLLNYVVQTTFVPELVRAGDYRLLSALAMANPRSLAWALEMWGYGLLGVATWLVARTFRGSRIARATSLAFAANGAVSIVGAFATAFSRDWLMTPAGLTAFAAWNVLVVAMGALAYVALGPKEPRLIEAEVPW